MEKLKLQIYSIQTLCLHKKKYKFSLLIFLCSIIFFSKTSCSTLSFNFYGLSCPSAELMVKNTVRSASSMDPTIPGKLLRLLFHDCFVEVIFLVIIDLIFMHYACIKEIWIINI